MPLPDGVIILQKRSLQKFCIFAVFCCRNSWTERTLGMILSQGSSSSRRILGLGPRGRGFNSRRSPFLIFNHRALFCHLVLYLFRRLFCTMGKQLQPPRKVGGKRSSARRESEFRGQSWSSPERLEASLDKILGSKYATAAWYTLLIVAGVVASVIVLMLLALTLYVERRACEHVG